MIQQITNAVVALVNTVSDYSQTITQTQRLHLDFHNFKDDELSPCCDWLLHFETFFWLFLIVLISLIAATTCNLDRNPQF